MKIADTDWREHLRTLLSLVTKTFLAGWLASRVMLLVHEFLGHGLMATLLGARAYDPHLSFFGDGSIAYERDFAFSPKETMLISAAGLTAQLIVGTVTLFLLKKVRGKVWLEFFCLSFSAISFLHFCYAIVSDIDHQHGDLWNLAENFSIPSEVYIAIGCILTVVAGLYFARLFSQLALRSIPPCSYLTRVLIVGFSVLTTAALQLTLSVLEGMGPVELSDHPHPIENEGLIVGGWIWIILAISLALSALYTLRENPGPGVSRGGTNR